MASLEDDNRSIPSRYSPSRSSQDDDVSIITDDISQISDLSPSSVASSASRSRSRGLLFSKSRSKTSGFTQDIMFQEEPASHILYNKEDHEVILEVRELERNIKRVIVENRVFQRFLEQNEPESLVEKPAGHKKVSIAAKSIMFTKSAPGRGSMLSLVKLPTLAPAPKQGVIKINITQKSDLLLRELEGIQADAEESKRKLQKSKRILTARLEEAETRKEELEASLASFEEFKQTYESITLAKLLRFMDEWSKASRITADKIRLRYSSLKVQFHKLTGVLNHKQMIGENLQEIDFEQLRIENVHLTEKIEKKTLLLLELKKMTGEANLKLTQNKTILQQNIMEKETILQAIKRVEKDISKSDDEIMKTYPELHQVKREYDRWKKKIKRYQAPDVIDYVKYKAEVDVLKKDLKIWSRRSTLKNLALDIKQEEMKKLLRCKKVHSCWFE